MPVKINFLFIVLHIYIITYLVVTVVGAPDYVMQILHIVAPFIIIPFLYIAIRSAFIDVAQVQDDRKEGYKTL